MSSRFRAIVGESPSNFQRRYAAAGNGGEARLPPEDSKGVDMG